MKNFNQNRREFFKLTGGIALLAVAAPGKELRADPTAPISDTDPTAKALGYVSDRSKADSTKYPQLKTAEGKKQSCANCEQFTSKTKPYGTCRVLVTGLVNQNGWCSAWMKKANQHK